MNPELAVDVFKTLVTFTVYVMAPFLIAMVAVGLVTSLIQSVTSIQEQTLTFAPKVFILAVLLLLTAPWLMRTMVDFATVMIERMPEMAQ